MGLKFTIPPEDEDLEDEQLAVKTNGENTVVRDPQNAQKPTEVNVEKDVEEAMKLSSKISENLAKVAHEKELRGIDFN